MAQFPTTPVPQFPYDLVANWKTIISAFDSGKEQRRKKQLYAKYDVSLTYNVMTAANMALLWAFYQARNGSYEAFYFYTLESEAWTGLFVGIGDAATVTFDIPGKTTSAQVIYINGVVQTTGHTHVTGGGTESSDRITFDSAPALNAIITCDFTGYMRIRCRFDEDKMTKSRFAGALYRTGLKLKGLAAA